MQTYVQKQDVKYSFYNNKNKLNSFTFISGTVPKLLDQSYGSTILKFKIKNERWLDPVYSFKKGPSFMENFIKNALGVKDPHLKLNENLAHVKGGCRM